MGSLAQGFALVFYLFFDSGVIFDATGSYAAAFANGVAWNALNLVLLLIRARMGSVETDPGFAT